MDATRAVESEATSADDALSGTVRYPLEGGPPVVTGRPEVEVAPGVWKQLLSASARRDEQPPSRECKCFVHFQAWTAQAPHEEVENTHKRERAGLGAALLTMLPVAPHAALLYDVHLLAVQRAQEETPVKARGDMLWEERMAEASRCRDRGNAAYKAADSAEAMTQYLMGLSYIDDNMMAQLFGRYLDESSALKCALHLNVAAAALSLRQHDDALTHCRAALALEPKSVKALYRKGKAHAALGQDDAARESLNQAARLDPNDSAVRTALRELDAEERAKQAARRAAFSGLFGSGAAPETKHHPDGRGEVIDAAAQSDDSTQTQTGMMSRLLGSWWRS